MEGEKWAPCCWRYVSWDGVIVQGSLWAVHTLEVRQRQGCMTSESYSNSEMLWLLSSWVVGQLVSSRREGEPRSRQTHLFWYILCLCTMFQKTVFLNVYCLLGSTNSKPIENQMGNIEILASEDGIVGGLPHIFNQYSAWATSSSEKYHSY